MVQIFGWSSCEQAALRVQTFEVRRLKVIPAANFTTTVRSMFYILSFINCSLPARADFFEDFILVYIRSNHIGFGL